MNAEHISDHDLERYYLGMVTNEDELERLEEHLLCCPPCVERVEETQDYVNAIRVAATMTFHPSCCHRGDCTPLE